MRRKTRPEQDGRREGALGAGQRCGCVIGWIGRCRRGLARHVVHGLCPHLDEELVQVQSKEGAYCG